MGRTEDNLINEDYSGFEASFILSKNELYTLILMFGKPAEGAKAFMDRVLSGAVKDNLSQLVDKKMAYRQGGDILISSEIKIFSKVICWAKFSETENADGKTVYIFSSPFVKIKCEQYSKSENFIKLTPVKPENYNSESAKEYIYENLRRNTDSLQR